MMPGLSAAACAGACALDDYPGHLGSKGCGVGKDLRRFHSDLVALMFTVRFRSGERMDCSFTSIDQCQAGAVGLPASCRGQSLFLRRRARVVTGGNADRFHAPVWDRCTGIADGRCPTVPSIGSALPLREITAICSRNVRVL